MCQNGKWALIHKDLFFYTYFGLCTENLSCMVWCQCCSSEMSSHGVSLTKLTISCPSTLLTPHDLSLLRTVDINVQCIHEHYCNPVVLRVTHLITLTIIVCRSITSWTRGGGDEPLSTSSDGRDTVTKKTLGNLRVIWKTQRRPLMTSSREKHQQR